MKNVFITSGLVSLPPGAINWSGISDCGISGGGGGGGGGL